MKNYSSKKVKPKKSTARSSKSRSRGRGQKSSKKTKPNSKNPKSDIYLKQNVKRKNSNTKKSTISNIKQRFDKRPATVSTNNITKSKSKQMADKSHISFDSSTIGDEFTAYDIKQFLRRNHFTHFIRSDALLKTFQLQCESKMITIGGIGAPYDSGKDAKINGTLVLVNRYKIRLLRFDN